MGANSSIEWTDATWNPTRGCSRVSPGCGGAADVGGCYADRQAYRFSGPGMPYEGLVRLGKQGPRWTGDVRLVPEKLVEPLRWTNPRRVFVNSMSDLFHETLSNKEIASIFGVMAACPHHTFQVLTKRASRMREWFDWLDAENPTAEGKIMRCFGAACERLRDEDGLFRGAAGRMVTRRVARAWPLPNVWIGVSAEDQQRAEERVPELLRVPAAVRFVSFEPALGPINFAPWIGAVEDEGDGHCVRCRVGHELYEEYQCPPGFGPFLNWVIVGGESGPGARPFDVAWARSVVTQCRAAGVACFVKQLGANPYAYQLGDVSRLPQLVARKGGDWSEW